MGRTLFAVALLLASSAVGYVLRCGGPRPEIVAAGVRAGPGGDHAAATVRNRGGQGEVDVRFRAVERRSGRRVAAEESVQLGDGEEAEVVAASPLPAGEWDVEAEAEYPPG